MAGAFVRAIASRLGEPAPIAEIEPIARDAALLELLHANGLRDYRRSELEPPQLALAAMRGALELSGLDPRQIDAVVWSSTSFQQRDWYTDRVSECLGELGLWTATPVGITLSECGNLLPALRAAAGLVATGSRNVLLVTVDRCASPEQRLVQPAVAVLSDGAAACIVSAEARGFEILGLAHCANHRARNAFESVLQLRHNAEGMRRATAAAMKQAAAAPERIAVMVTNNLSRSVIELFAAQAGVAIGRAFLDHLASHGHVFAADGLVNLAACPHAADDLILLATSGVCNWGSVILRAHQTGGESSRCQI